MVRLTVLTTGGAVMISILTGCSTSSERGRKPVELEACAIERAACRERCRGAKVNAFSCRVTAGRIVHLECICEPSPPIEQ